MLDLDQYMQYDNKKMGQVKLTIAKFYRISGGSTQHKGVIPDIEFPSIFANKEYGEDASIYSLPYDSINPESYSKQTKITEQLNKLKQLHNARMLGNAEYVYLLEDIETVKKSDVKQYVSVNEALYKKELKENETKNKARKDAREKTKANQGKDASNADLILDEAKELIIDQMLLK
jgi:carboxyl-terminal processing protease